MTSEKSWLHYCSLLCVVMIAAACSAEASDEPSIEDDIIDYSTEMAQLFSDTFEYQTVVAATVAAIGTQTMDYERYNSALGGTVVVLMPPTSEQRLVANDITGPLPLEVYDISDGQMRFVQIGPAGVINDADCFADKQQYYPSDSAAIYMTAVALNLQAGTRIQADWQYGNDLVFSNAWVAPQAQDYRCIALAMRPANTEFLSGNWSVTLSINGNSIASRAFFIR